MPLNISDFFFFFVKIVTPPEKSYRPLLTGPTGPVKPPPFENLVEGSPPQQKGGGGGTHYVWAD